MGNKYSVSVWCKEKWMRHYEYREVYRGEFLLRALWTMLQCKNLYGCVKLEVRIPK